MTEKLQTIVTENRLDAFYDNARVHAIVRQLESVDFPELGRLMRISPELICDLVSIALYDVVIFVDDSGSVVFEEDGTRLDDLKFIVSKIAQVATLLEPDSGIRVCFMNSPIIGEGIRSATQVEELISQVSFSGMTPLGSRLKSKVFDPLVLNPAERGTLEKPVLVIVVTDGEPTREPKDTLRIVIREAKELLAHTDYGSGALAIQLGQVGTDEAAQAFLSSIDCDPIVGKMVDCTANYELESDKFAREGLALSPELWLLKLCVGAIDRSYDDELGNE